MAILTCETISHWVPHLLYPLVCYLGCFHVLAIINKAVMKIGAHVPFSNQCFHFFWIYTQEWNCWITWHFWFIFLRNLHTVFPPTLQDGSLFSTSSPTFVICSLFDDGHSDRCVGDIVTSIYVSLIISDVTHIYMCLFAICMSSLGEKKPKLSIKVFFPFF